MRALFLNKRERDGIKQGATQATCGFSADTVRCPERVLYCCVKRGFDVAFSLLVLVGFSWFYLLVAVAVKLDDPQAPVLFRQVRVGEGGRQFEMYKFRSMVQGADLQAGSLREHNQKDGPVFKIADDPRVTRVGRILRKTGIDELPQFFNVLRGDMSIVGPRPALPREVAEYTPYQRQRLSVPQGLTCYWQIQPRRDSIGFDNWVEMDLMYIANRCVWLDLKLIVKTLGAVVTAQGS